MSRCPICKAQISGLDYTVDGYMNMWIYIEDGKVHHTEEGFVQDDENFDVLYTCPMCGKEIADNITSALKILRNDQ